MGILDIASDIEGSISSAFSSVFSTITTPFLNFATDIEGDVGSAWKWTSNAWHTASEWTVGAFKEVGNIAGRVLSAIETVAEDAWWLISWIFDITLFLVNNPIMLIALLAAVAYTAWTIWTTRYVRLLE